MVLKNEDLMNIKITTRSESLHSRTEKGYVLMEKILLYNLFGQSCPVLHGGDGKWVCYEEHFQWMGKHDQGCGGFRA